MQVVSNYFKGIERDLSQLKYGEPKDDRAKRISSLALRIVGAIGLVFAASLLITGVTGIITASGGLPLIIGAAALSVICHDCTAIGMNLSDALDVRTLNNTNSPAALYRKFETGIGGVVHKAWNDPTPGELRGTWLFGSIYRIVN